ncbi:hypothetical protein NUW58_g1435 [Xylaria curta]|uniref:Uncharacterized protein n=1 Tax=Xylaria curta TaxID=42375 RepID=A0ACC1PKS4_9PEZI|nr:hypothetical protein NUW58_g1435 [Xylaria curta]
MAARSPFGFAHATSTTRATVILNSDNPVGEKDKKLHPSGGLKVVMGWIVAELLVQELEIYPQKVKVHVVYPGSISSPGFERENKTKPEITLIIEESDPVQTPDVVAANAISGLEKGHYYITVAFLGSVFRWASLGGSPRNNWIIDTFMSWIISLVWIFVLPDIYGKIRKYGKANGHPVNFRKKENLTS